MVWSALAVAVAVDATPAVALFSHDDWTRVLQRFVDDRGRVDYDALSHDRALLDAYLERVAAVSPRSNPELFPDSDHELAYWINAYNALVFQGVLARGPERRSVWTGGLVSGYAFFVRMDVRLGGEAVSLKTLEDDWIRAVYHDPRVHAALNCASRSCPELPREAFVGPRLDEQLDLAMRRFVAEERNVRLAGDGRVELSKIFDWFAKDFLEFERSKDAARPSLVGYVNRYRAVEARLPEDAAVRFIPYDKGINAQEPAKGAADDGRR